MNDSPSKSRNRAYWLQFLLVAVALVGLVFGISKYRISVVNRHNNAISELRDAGADLTLTQWHDGKGRFTTFVINDPGDAKESFLMRLGFYPSVSAPLIDFSSSEMTEDRIRALLPRLREIIPQRNENESQKAYTAILIRGNPKVTQEFVYQIQDSLPNCKILFSADAVPPPTPHSR